MSDEKEALRQNTIQQIEEAFARVPTLRSRTISIGSMDEPTIDKAYIGKHWQELPLDILIHYRDSLPFFVPKAFRFFLPAYMRLTLNTQDSHVLGPSIVQSLAAPLSEYPTALENFHKRTKSFKIQEIEAIIAFLNTYVGLYPVLGKRYEMQLRDMIETTTLYWMLKYDEMKKT